ncbi:MAG: DUF58 domain-containing protein [Acidimicrobiales bacterium]
MPTRRGWALGAGAVVLAAAGRLLGIYELFVLAAGAGGLLLAGAVTVATRAVDLDASRTVRPIRVYAGGNSRVELAIRNRARRPSPVVTVRDSFSRATTAGADPGARRQARLLLAPLVPGQEDRASYRLPAEHRGIFSVGPLEAEVGDAFGLWSKVATIAPAIELTVYPPVEAVPALAHAQGDDPTAGAPRPATVGPTGEDLYGLRPYQVGDDLRRVHWPSTARTGDLVVRQLELPWQGRATVLLDVRAKVHSDASMEAAVSAAASIVSASWAGGALVRLAATDGTDSGFAAGHAHFEAVMEHLAVVGLGRVDGLDAAVASLHRAGNGGAIAVVTTSAAPAADLERLAGLSGRFGSLTLVVVEGPPVRSRPGPGGSSPPGGARAGPGAHGGARAGGLALVRVAAGGALAPAWEAAAGRRPAGSRR